MGGRGDFRSPVNETRFPLENSHEKYVQKKSLDAISSGIMFTPCQRCTDVQNNAYADGACGMEPRASNVQERISA